jgi:hypothetical protein
VWYIRYLECVLESCYLLNGRYISCCDMPSSEVVTGALSRMTVPKIATAPKTQSRIKDKDNFKVESKR